MSSTFSAALLGAALLVGATVFGTGSVSAAPVAGAKFDVGAQTETVQYGRDRYRRPDRSRRRDHRRPRCHWELKRIRSSYGWRTKRVRVCRRAGY